LTAAARCSEDAPANAAQRARLAIVAGPGTGERVGMAIFELRQYHVRPGQQERWVRFMEEEIIPFQTKMGMVIIGSWVGEADDSVYIWLRRFDSEEAREHLYERVYQSDFWKDTIAPQVPEMLDRELMKITRLVPTPRSVVQ
jgi:hypothetical protein